MMRRAFKLLVLRERLLARHWSRRDWLSGGLNLAVAVAAYVATKRILAGMEEVQMFAVAGLMGGTFLAGFVFTAANFMKAWFSSPDAFYLMTLPAPVGELYSFHYLDIVLRFLKYFGHLLGPVSLSLGAVMGGWPGALLLLGALSLSVGLAVECGFFYMFFVFRGNKLLLRALGGALAGLLVLAGAVWLGLVWPATAAGVSAILIIMVFWHTPRYAESSIRECREASSGRFAIYIATPWQRLLAKTILDNHFLKPRFRAFLYREVATDARNIVFCGKYLAVMALFFLYWPLMRVDLIAESGLAGALIFCFLVFATSIFESFITTFAKEGDRIVFLLPAFHSWQGVGLAKFLAAVLEMLPLLLVAVVVVGSRWHWSGWEALTFAAGLLLMIAVQLAVTIVMAACLLTMENHNFTLWEGMVYEQVLGNVDPLMLRRYLPLQVVPALLAVIIWILHASFPAEDFMTVLWYFNILMAAVVAGILYAGRRVFALRLTSLLK
ncbi:hypothetical protein [Syntrophomonas curvata]